MKYEDWNYFATVLCILGILLLFGGGIAYLYIAPIYLYGYQVGTGAPYRDYAIPLLFLGFVLNVIGLVSFSRAEEERKIEGE